MLIMNKKSLIVTILSLAIFVFIVDLYANINFLYFKFWWLDNVMHTTGGLFVGLTSLYIYYYSGLFNAKYKENDLIISLSITSAIIIGLFWELFEVGLETFIKNRYGIEIFLALSIEDTIYDILFDITGSIIAIVLFIYLWKKEI